MGLRFQHVQKSGWLTKLHVEFTIKPTDLITAIVYHFQYDPPEEAIPAIAHLNRTDVARLAKECYLQNGLSQEFIGEDVKEGIEEAAEGRVTQSSGLFSSSRGIHMSERLHVPSNGILLS